MNDNITFERAAFIDHATGEVVKVDGKNVGYIKEATCDGEWVYDWKGSPYSTVKCYITSVDGIRWSKGDAIINEERNRVPDAKDKAVARLVKRIGKK